MTKEEFDAMGITEMDLVCIMSDDLDIRSKDPIFIVGAVTGGYIGYEGSDVITVKNIFCKQKRRFVNECYPRLNLIKSIEILKKDFWKG